MRIPKTILKYDNIALDRVEDPGPPVAPTRVTITTQSSAKIESSSSTPERKEKPKSAICYEKPLNKK